MQIILGPNVVFYARTEDEIEELLHNCEKYLDQDTKEFLKVLIVHKEITGCRAYIKDTLLKRPNNIAENIRRIDMAKDLDLNIQMANRGDPFINAVCEKKFYQL